MKFILKVILIAGLAYLTGLILPWWSAVVSAFLINAIISSGRLNSFLSGFLGVGLVWSIYSWIIYSGANSDFIERLAPLFFANEGLMLIVYTAIIGALAGGLGGLSGSFFRRIFGPNKSSTSYY